MASYSGLTTTLVEISPRMYGFSFTLPPIQRANHVVAVELYGMIAPAVSGIYIYISVHATAYIRHTEAAHTSPLYVAIATFRETDHPSSLPYYRSRLCHDTQKYVVTLLVGVVPDSVTSRGTRGWQRLAVYDSAQKPSALDVHVALATAVLKSIHVGTRSPTKTRLLRDAITPTFTLELSYSRRRYPDGRKVPRMTCRGVCLYTSKPFRRLVLAVP